MSRESERTRDLLRAAASGDDAALTELYERHVDGLYAFVFYRVGRDPSLVHYPLPDGRFKLAAGWLIDACGWKGKTVGHAGVYEKQALVLVNRGGATGAEVLTLARAIQESVYGRFGIRLEPEPTIV